MATGYLAATGGGLSLSKFCLCFAFPQAFSIFSAVSLLPSRRIGWVVPVDYS